MTRQSGQEPRLTLLDLIEAVSDFSNNEDEVVATVLHMLRTGHARPVDAVQASGRLSHHNLAIVGQSAEQPVCV